MTQDIQRLTPTAEAVLSALAKYQYLTAAQMRRMGVSQSSRHLYATLRAISNGRHRLINALDFGVMPLKGRLPVLYCLTRRGADTLAEAWHDSTQVLYPKRVRLFGNEYFHRVETVDFQIAVALDVENRGGQVDWFLTYFSSHPTTKGRFRAATLIDSQHLRFQPDAVFMFTDAQAVPRLCCYELHRGRDLPRLMKQIRTYCEAIASEAIERQFEYEAAARVLITLESPDLIERAVKALDNMPISAPTKARFFFKVTSEIEENPLHNWASTSGHKNII